MSDNFFDRFLRRLKSFYESYQKSLLVVLVCGTASLLELQLLETSSSGTVSGKVRSHAPSAVTETTMNPIPVTDKVHAEGN